MFIFGRVGVCLLLLQTLAGYASAQTPEKPPSPPALHLGALTLKPSGFLELIGMMRTATTADSVSTHFGAIPLTETPAETIASPAHSRLMLSGALPAGPLQFAGYVETDFLSPVAGGTPWRWRQYWGSAKLANWEVLGGQTWSLLRPNRVGVEADRNTMNTDVTDPAYHVGVAGLRHRQVRIVRKFGAQHAALSWESSGVVLAKLTTDRGAGHFEVAGLAGSRERRGAQVSAVWNAVGRLRLVAQQFVARHALSEALGVVPAAASGFATIQGVEAPVKRSFELYSYAGLVYGGRTTGNRLVRQYTAGANWYKRIHGVPGAVTLSVQYSYLDRAVWSGRSGSMQFVMCRMRLTVQ